MYVVMYQVFGQVAQYTMCIVYDRVPQGDTLTIQNGVTVKLMAGTEWFVMEP